MKPISLFYSYAHEDERFRENLEKHLSNLKRQEVIHEWHDRKIIAGQSWADEIDDNLKKADVILLLISADFINSDYCYEVEMKCALERHDQRQAKVVPILLRDTDLTGSPFMKLQGLPTNLKPINEWQYEDKAYVDVVNGLRKLIKEVQNTTELNAIEDVKPHTELSAPTINQNIHREDDFTKTIREKINAILSSNKPATIALSEALQKNQLSNLTPDKILLPTDGLVSPEIAIREWRKIVEACLKQSREHIVEIKQFASDILGWLILLCINGDQFQRDDIIDLDKAVEVVLPLQTSAGIEIFIARLQERSAKFQLKGSDKVLGGGHIDPAELELAFCKHDCLREIEKLVYVQVFRSSPILTENWLGKLKYTIEFDRDLDKMYFLKLSYHRRDELLEVLKKLKLDLPDLRILITGANETGGDSILIMDETRLESLVLAFLRTLADYP